MAVDDDGWRPIVAPEPRRLHAIELPRLEIPYYDWPAAATIPPRPWLYGTWLQRAQVTVLVADSGSGKTLLSMVIACEVAAGRSVLGHKVWGRCNSLYFYLEDPRHEANRRFEAIRQRHHFADTEVRDHLLIHIGRERRLLMGQISQDSVSVVFPDREAIIRVGRSAEVGLIVVDPAIASYRGVHENSNEEMEEVVTAWAEVGDELNCAVLLCHHTRKAATGDIDDGRGASSIKGAARVGLRMSAMSAADAERYRVPPPERSRYLHVADGKVNMAAKSAQGWWGRMVNVSIGNPAPPYVNGDSVATVVPWSPPSLFSGLSWADTIAALAELDLGRGDGDRYGFAKQSRNRWSGYVLTSYGCSDDDAKRILEAWKLSGLLTVRPFSIPASHHPSAGVFIDPEKFDQMRQAAAQSSSPQEP